LDHFVEKVDGKRSAILLGNDAPDRRSIVSDKLGNRRRFHPRVDDADEIDADGNALRLEQAVRIQAR
jgi:hypothetical protein